MQLKEAVLLVAVTSDIWFFFLSLPSGNTSNTSKWKILGGIYEKQICWVTSMKSSCRGFSLATVTPSRGDWERVGVAAWFWRAAGLRWNMKEREKGRNETVQLQVDAAKQTRRCLCQAGTGQRAQRGWRWRGRRQLVHVVVWHRRRRCHPRLATTHPPWRLYLVYLTAQQRPDRQ